MPNSYVIDYLEQYIIRLFLRQISKKKKKTNWGVIGQLLLYKHFTELLSNLSLKVSQSYSLQVALFVGYSAT